MFGSVNSFMDEPIQATAPISEAAVKYLKSVEPDVSASKLPKDIIRLTKPDETKPDKAFKPGSKPTSGEKPQA